MRMAELLVAPFLLAGPTSGGWEGVSWGARPAEAAAALGGAAVRPRRAGDASPLSARIRTTHKMLGHSFAADLLFDRTDRLAAVRLILRDPSRCEALYGELLSRYGSPIEAARPLRNDAWTDRRSGGRVSITDARADPNVRSCVVTFSPPARNGLVDPRRRM